MPSEGPAIGGGQVLGASTLAFTGGAFEVATAAVFAFVSLLISQVARKTLYAYEKVQNTKTSLRRKARRS